MASLFDLAGAPELIHWQKRLGPAPAGGMALDAPAAAASRFGVLSVSGLAAGKGFYVVGAGMDSGGATAVKLVVTTSGIITENSVAQVVSTFGASAPTASGTSGRLVTLPSGGLLMYSISTNPMTATPLNFPLYVPPGSVASLCCTTVNVQKTLSLAWLEVA